VISTLYKIYNYKDLSPEDLQLIMDAHIKVVFKKNDLLLEQGQTANEYYCLEDGLVRSFAISSEGNEITTGFFGKDEIVIEVASLFLRIPTKENIQALTDCVCWRIDLKSFQELFHSVAGFTEWGRAWMSGVLFQSKQRSLSMITDSATERYLALQNQHPEIIQHAPLKYIASYLGITDTSLSRIRKVIGKK
jgi:CRP/FNR family transcriptional regulator, anaerobic regulatory protein